MRTDKFYLKYGNHRPFYIRHAMRAARPRILSAVQIEIACNELLRISAKDPLKFSHGNVARALSLMRDVSRTKKATERNKTGEHAQGWNLVPPTPRARLESEVVTLTRQISLEANELPLPQRIAALKRCLAIFRSGKL